MLSWRIAANAASKYNKLTRITLSSSFSRGVSSVIRPDFGPQYKHNVMFLCNHNSCRSQIADGWLRTLRTKADGVFSIGVASAGIEGGTGLKPGAVTVMGEAGVDISQYSSDAMAIFSPSDFNCVISCCGCQDKLSSTGNEAWKHQAIFEDWNLDDPPALDKGDLEEYRRVRNEIKVKIETLVTLLEN